MSTIFFLLSLSLPAQTDRDVRTVSIDWSSIAEQTVERCNLTLLQSMLLQGLIEAGFAVVDAPLERTIRLTLREGRGGISVHVERAGAVAKRGVGFGKRCDSTIGVELQAAAIAAAREVEELTPSPVVVAPQPSSPPTEAPARGAELERHTTWTRPEPSFVVDQVTRPRDTRGSTAAAWFGRIGAGVAASNADSPFSVGSLQLGRGGAHWSAAVDLDVAFRSSGGVRVVEPAIGPELAWGDRVGGFWLSAGVAAQLLAHVYASDDGDGSHLDVRFMLPLRVEHRRSGIGVLVAPSVRLHGVEYRLEDRLAYAIGRAGGFMALTWHLPF